MSQRRLQHRTVQYKASFTSQLGRTVQYSTSWYGAVQYPTLGPGWWTLGDAAGKSQIFPEVAALERVRHHPHFVTALDAFHTKGVPGGSAAAVWIVMVREGPSLSSMSRQQGFGGLALRDLQHLAHEVGSALDYLHQSGLLHADLKPSNILGSPDGVRLEYRIADMGSTMEVL